MKTSKSVRSLIFSMVLAALFVLGLFTGYFLFAQNGNFNAQKAEDFEHERHIGSFNLDSMSQKNEVIATGETYKPHFKIGMENALGIKSNCTGDGNQCPNNCNGYAYVGYHYGSINIPYTIDQTAIDQGLEDLIEQAASNWNSTYLYDEHGQAVKVINLQRNGEPEFGRPVCNISYNGKHEKWAGVHISTNVGGNLSTTRIEIYEAGQSLSTIMHEMGHLLGLDDLDEKNYELKDEERYHKNVLMGYGRSYSVGIEYQDIQGAALFNLTHTEHTFTRYTEVDNENRDICFYCDGYKIRSNDSSSERLIKSEECVHTFKRLASSGDWNWLKCTQCYKVVESDFNLRGIDNNGYMSLEITGILDPQNQTSIVIPAEIGGQRVTQIGSGAFANISNLQEVTCTYITNIKNYAFENCNSLSKITGLNNVQEIGSYAFKGCVALQNISLGSNLSSVGANIFLNCNQLEFSVNSVNSFFTASDNILYNKAKTDIIASGKVSSSINIPDSVIEIRPYAFSNNSNLVSLNFETLPIIGKNAFDNCTNLREVLIYSFEDPYEIGENSFSNTNFILYVPYISQSAYEPIFGKYTENISSKIYQILYISNDMIEESNDIYYGAYIENIKIPQKSGYTFKGWYDNKNFTGKKYENGELFNLTQNLSLYAKWEQNTYDVTLDPNGGTLKGNNTFKVDYDQNFSTTTTATLEGNKIEGWYDSDGVKYLTASGESTRPWDKDSNATLYAHWTVKSYQIQINDNGSIVWLGAEGLSDVPCSIEYGTVLSAINLIATFKASNHGFKEGKIFDHFEYDNSTINWEKIPDLGEDGAIVTIIPVWEKETHTIYFNTMRSIACDPIIVKYDENIQLYDLKENGGYTFIGWHANSVDGTLVNWSKMPDLTPDRQADGSITLFANWIANKYVVTLNKQGGVGGTDNVLAEFDSAMPIAIAPTRTGYTFMGYFSQYDGNGTQYYSSSMQSVTNWNVSSTATLYANWKANQYVVTIKMQDKENNSIQVTATYDEYMPIFSEYAPKYRGYRFIGIYDNTRYTGDKYYESYWDLNDGYDQSLNTNYVWKNTASKTLYVKWEPVSMSMAVGYYCSDGLDTVRYFNITTGKSLTLTALDFDGYVFKEWLVLVRAATEWGIGEESEIRTEKSISYVMEAWLGGDSKYVFGCMYEKACVAEGTLITLADGTQKAVETLTGNEQLLVWNMLTGAFDSAPILFIDHDEAYHYEVINLTFSDGTTVKVISEHGFFDFDLNEYVFLRRDAAKYIGHWFNKQTTDAAGNMIWTKVQLESVDVRQEYTTAWSPVTYGHLCYYVNGMLSMPGATEGLINIFDVDPVTMKIDEEAYAADIAEYGLFTYEEFAELYPVPEVIFEAFGGQYLKVAMGKGLLTEDMLKSLIARYSVFFEGQA